MWKRDAAVIPSNGQSAATLDAPRADALPSPPSEPREHGTRDVSIGKSVVIKGELNASEDLTIEGQVEGKIDLREHVLTIGTHGKIRAQVLARMVIVLGQVSGNVTAGEKVEIRATGSVDGDIVAPRVAIAEGAHFHGSVDMQSKTAPHVISTLQKASTTGDGMRSLSGPAATPTH